MHSAASLSPSRAAFPSIPRPRPSSSPQFEVDPVTYSPQSSLSAGPQISEDRTSAHVSSTSASTTSVQQSLKPREGADEPSSSIHGRPMKGLESLGGKQAELGPSITLKSGNRGLSKGGKIGKSFETLLKSDETWILKETAAVAETQPSPKSRREGSRLPSFRSGVPQHRVISRTPKYIVDTGGGSPSSSPVIAGKALENVTPPATPDARREELTPSASNRQTDIPSYPVSPVSSPRARARRMSASSRSAYDRGPSTSRSDGGNAAARFGPESSSASLLHGRSGQMEADVRQSAQGATPLVDTTKSRSRRSGGFMKLFRSGRSNEAPKTSSTSRIAIGGGPSSTSVATDASDSESSRFSSAKTAKGHEPVPQIPRQYANEKTSIVSGLREDQDQRSRVTPRQSPVRPLKGDGSLSPPSSNGKRSSMPSSPTMSRQRVALAMPRSPDANFSPATPMHKPQSSSGDMRTSLKAWESEIDDTLKSSGSDINTKTVLRSPSWSEGSPRLPEISAISSRSTADHIQQQQGIPQIETNGSAASSSNIALSAPLLPHENHCEASDQQDSRAPLLRNREALADDAVMRTNASDSVSVAFDPHLGGAAHGDGLAMSSGQAPIMTRTPSDRMTSDRPHSASRDGNSLSVSKPSDLSARSGASFETAREGGDSSFDRSRDLSDGVRDSTAEADIKPEQSIRVIPSSPMGRNVATFLSNGEVAGSNNTSGSDVTRALDVNHLDALSRAAQVASPHSFASDGLLRRSSQASTYSSRPQTANRTNSALSLQPLITSRLRDVSDGEDDDVLEESVEVQARQLAKRCWDEDESWLKKEKIAEWLGGAGSLNRAARKFYFDSFDFTGLRVDMALRKLCDKLFLRAETQQVDRILAAFSFRYWHCNPLPVYVSEDVVHSITFSLLLLNTDLHIAEISERMTKQQFLRNTMSAISQAAPERQTRGASMMPSRSVMSTNSLSRGDADTASIHTSNTLLPDGSTVESSGETGIANALRPSISRRDSAGSGLSQSAQAASSRQSVRSNPTAKIDADLEGLLREMYNAVKSDRIRLPMTDLSASAASLSASSRSFRSPLGLRPVSVSSSNRMSQLKRGSIRGIAGLLGSTSTQGFRSEDSFSQASSDSRSHHEGSATGGDRTIAPSRMSMSASSRISPPPPSLGFAGSLSQVIISEAQDEDHSAASCSSDAEAEEIEDAELALLGPPWAKEGVLTRKHYWAAPQKRAKDKSWVEVFVVVSAGTLSMFKFGESQSSKKPDKLESVGGGNWLSNATLLAAIPLAQTLSNALPSPGYNRSRPYVFALTQSSGSVLFFQAGTEDLVQEWVATCNYWAARTSRQPLTGGVSNMEYGWNKVLPVTDEPETFGSGTGGIDEADEEEEGEYLNDDVQSGHKSGRPKASMDSVGFRPSDSVHRRDNVVSSNGDNRSIRSFGSSRGVYQGWQAAASNLFGSGGKRRGSRMLSPTAGASSDNLAVWPSASSPSMGPVSQTASRQSAIASANLNDRMQIHTWRAPAPYTNPSALKEQDQLTACQSYIHRLEEELTEHNGLRTRMMQLYTGPASVSRPIAPDATSELGRSTPEGQPATAASSLSAPTSVTPASSGSNLTSSTGGSAAYQKSLSNWTLKSSYLLSELVRWKVYVDCLIGAMEEKDKKRAAKVVERSLKRADELNEKQRGGGERSAEAEAEDGGIRLVGQNGVE